MPQVNFYLKKTASNGKALIYLKFQYFKQRLVFTFRQSIEPIHWNYKKQRIKSNTYIASDGKHYVNDLLDNLENLCLTTYNEEMRSGIPTTFTIKKRLQNFLSNNTDTEQNKALIPGLYDFIRQSFLTGIVKHHGNDKRPSTLKGYKTSLHSLIEFEKKEKYCVSYESINLSMFYKYVSFLKSKGLSHNTVAKRIRTLKVFMGEANDLGYTSNLQFKNKKFSVAEKEVDAVYLTEDEIISLYNYDFSDNKRLEQVRDLFVFGCFTGLRYSDYSQIRSENIVNHDGDMFLQIQTVKTDTLVVIPCNPIVLEIFEKYKHNENKLPRSISGQKFNNYIKELSAIVGLTQKGRLLSEPGKELFECISSHTARRSAVTNYYLQGFPVIDLMQITGHRSQAAFLRYIRVSKLQTAQRLNQHIKKNWTRNLLRAI